MLFNLFVLSFLLPFVLSFQITVPDTVKVNNPTTVHWIRNNGDGGSFSLLLRRDNQDRGGEIVGTVQSTTESTGPVTFTAKEEAQYLIEIIEARGSIGSNDRPNQISASSNKFTAIRDSNPPPSTQSSTSSSIPPPPTTTSISSTSAGTSTTSTTPQNTTPPANTSGSSTGSTNDANNGRDPNQNSITSTTVGRSATITQTPFTLPDPTPFSFGPPQATSSSGSADSGTSTYTSVSVPQTPTITISGTLDPSTIPSLAAGASRSSKTGVIIGAVFGALLFILLIVSLLFSYNRYQRRKRTQAFQRDLMVRRPGATPFDFAPAVTEEKDTTDTTLSFEQVSDPPSFVDSSYDQVSAPTPPSLHSYTPSTQSAVSSSPSVFYTAVPKPTQPQLAPGFTFPAIRPPSASARPDAPKTDRQIAIQNKMAQLRNRLVVLQAQNARGSGYSSESASMENNSQVEELQHLRDELQRLGEIMNSDWALRQTNDIPAGLV